jgi:S-DNA-T family DNA segregation ATPase FtsK/SpoIIIE
MFDNRSLKLDLFALALLAFLVFLALALVTYNPADPVVELLDPLDKLYQADSLVHPKNEEIANACGRWGALAADLLLTAFGIGAYYLVVALAAFDVTLLRRREVDSPLLRGTGWVASLLGFTTISAMLVPSLSPGPVIGSGGYLGALGRGLLEMHFATAGGLILASSLVIGGLLLCTDYMLIRAARLVLLSALAGVRLIGRPRAIAKKKSRKAEKPQSKTEQLAAEESDPVASPLPIRVRRKRTDDLADIPPAELPAPSVAAEIVPPAAEHQDDADELPQVEPAVMDDEAQEAEPVVKRKAAPKKIKSTAGGPHFRIRKRPEKSEREEVMTQLDEASRNEDPGEYELPQIDLLLEGDEVSFEQQEQEVRRKAKILEKTFAEFGFQVKVVEIETGPVIAQYEVQLEAGLRLSKITGLADDLAIALRVPSVRIVAPIPGKNTVGIEVPNETRQVVRLREVMEEANGKTKMMRIPLFLGKDVSGNPLVVDLSTLPHLLIAGRTGTGKSVCLNAIISSILMTRRPDEVRMLMIDPKMVELSGYGRLPHLMHPVVTDMRKAEAILAWAVEKMEERYALLARAGVRHISSYNQLGEEELMDRLEPEDDEQRNAIPVHLPYIVIVADEMADLMMTAGKEVEQHIIRLAQKSRAVGIHLILATQKPTVDVITGLIKSNLPARIAFQVASRTDSRVVLDEMGADKLLGNGDMLFLWPGTSTLLRGQGTYLSDDEIDSIVDCVSQHEQSFVNELVNMKVEQPDTAEPGKLQKRDELYESAVDIVVREGRGSVSLLQRALGIGYGRAARLIDFMSEDGIVGSYAGSQAREVLITLADWERMQGHDVSAVDSADVLPHKASAKPPSPPRRRRSNKILPEPDFEDQDDPAALDPRDASDLFDEDPDQYEDEERNEDDDRFGEDDRYEEDRSEQEDRYEDDTDEDAAGEPFQRRRYEAETA